MVASHISTKKVMWAGAAVIISLIVGIILLIPRLHKDVSTTIVEGDASTRKIINDELGFTFSIHTDFSDKSLVYDEVLTGDSRLLYKAYKPTTIIADSAIVDIFVEKGLRAPSNLLGKRSVEVIRDNSEKTLRNAYPSYSSLSNRIYTSETIGRDIFEAIFTYENKNGKMAQRLIGIPVDDDRVLYIRFQCPADMLAINNQKYFDPLFDSFSLP